MAILFLMLATYLAAALQTSLAPVIEVRHVMPDLFALVAIVWLLRPAVPHGFVAAGLVGLVYDLTSAAPLGIGLGLYSLVGYSICVLRGKLDGNHLLVQLPIVWLATTIIALGEAAAARLLGETDASLDDAGRASRERRSLYDRRCPARPDGRRLAAAWFVARGAWRVTRTTRHGPRATNTHLPTLPCNHRRTVSAGCWPASSSLARAYSLDWWRWRSAAAATSTAPRRRGRWSARASFRPCAGEFSLATGRCSSRTGPSHRSRCNTGILRIHPIRTGFARQRERD